MKKPLYLMDLGGKEIVLNRGVRANNSSAYLYVVDDG